MNSNQQTGATGQVERFDAYQVCPVLETATSHGEINCEAFQTLAEAFDAKDTSRDINGSAFSGPSTAFGTASPKPSQIERPKRTPLTCSIPSLEFQGDRVRQFTPFPSAQPRKQPRSAANCPEK